MEKVDFLRKKYPKFIFEKYYWEILNKNLSIFFDFRIQPDIYFRPKITIENVNKKVVERLGEMVLNNLVFHLGLIELLSYWKATCSPEIEIKTGLLNEKQIRWWEDLIMKGMGQFFYENKINFRQPNFLKIITLQELNIIKTTRGQISDRFKNRVLVPIGGGKDSIVTLEKLKKQKKKIGCFLVNPTEAMKKIVKVAKVEDTVVVRREIDPLLLKLNKKGYLNGHTPITAVISFLSVLTAVLFGYKCVAFSNEKSANEGNVKYLGRIINHQWSKSFEFEKKFRYYCKKYLAKNVNYFSYLRKYTELEIAKMFIKYPLYFSVFSSCNMVISKKLKKRWCGNCPKCLFVYAILYPFLEEKQILKIFGEDFFSNKKLLPVMKGLINPEIAKPFECVGTKRESILAFYLSWKLCRGRAPNKLPLLLRYFQDKILPNFAKSNRQVKSKQSFWPE